MVTAIWAALAMLDTGQGQREWSRQEFVSRLHRIGRGDSESKVLSVLGKPDDVWSGSDFPHSRCPSSWKSWSYGSNGHLSFPTLGRVEFEDERVMLMLGDDHNRHTAVPESVLHQFMVNLTTPIAGQPSFRPEPGYGAGEQDGLREDPLLVLQWSNTLRPLKKAWAVDILCELGLLSPFGMDEKTYWTCQALFTSPARTGLFQGAANGQYPMPRNFGLWPTFPVVFIRNVPFILPATVFFNGVNLLAMPWQIQRAAPRWTVRKTPVVPADDPFPSLAEVRKTGAWRSLYEGPGLSNERPQLESAVMTEAILLVRTVCKPDPSPAKRSLLPYVETDNDLERVEFNRCHKEFLRLGGHWDKKLQIYVRRDGSHV